MGLLKSTPLSSGESRTKPGADAAAEGPVAGAGCCPHEEKKRETQNVAAISCQPGKSAEENLHIRPFLEMNDDRGVHCKILKFKILNFELNFYT